MHYCLRSLLFIALSYFFDECFLLEILCDCHTMVKQAGQDLMLQHSAWSPQLFWWELWVGRRSWAWVATLAFRGSCISLVQEAVTDCRTLTAGRPSPGPDQRAPVVGQITTDTELALSEIFHALFHPTLAQCLVDLCPEGACPLLSLPDLLHRQRPTLLCLGSHIQHSSDMSCLLLVPTSLLTTWDHLGKAGPQEKQLPYLWKRWQGRDLQVISVSFARSYSTSPAAQNEVAQQGKEREHSTQKR